MYLGAAWPQCSESCLHLLPFTIKSVLEWVWQTNFNVPRASLFAFCDEPQLDVISKPVTTDSSSFVWVVVALNKVHYELSIQRATKIDKIRPNFKRSPNETRLTSDKDLGIKWSNNWCIGVPWKHQRNLYSCCHNYHSLYSRSLSLSLSQVIKITLNWGDTRRREVLAAAAAHAHARTQSLKTNCCYCATEKNQNCIIWTVDSVLSTLDTAAACLWWV